MQLRAWSGAVLLAFVLLAVHVLFDREFSALRGKTFDIYQMLLPAEPVAAPVFLVAIDDKSLETRGRWPWNRGLIADLVDTAADRGARAIGLDILFPEADAGPGGADGDRRLAYSLSRAPTVLAVSTDATPTASSTTPKAGWSLVGDVPEDLPALPGIVASLPIFNEAAAGLGVIRATPDSDGTLRRLPLIWLQADDRELRAWPTFALELVRLYLGEQGFTARMRDGGFDALKLGNSVFPLQPDGSIYLRERRGSLPVISATALLDGEPLPELKDAIVIIAVSAAGLDQFHITPAQVARLGSEVHGLVIEQLLARQFITEPAHIEWFERAWFAIGAILLVLLARLSGSRPLLAVPAMVLTIASPFIAGISAFAGRAVLAEGLQPAVGLLLVAVTSGYSHYRIAERKRRTLTRQFSQFLSPAIVAKLANDDAEALIAVEKREITVLMMDIRGFTPMTHSLAASEIVTVVNHFLSIATDEILKRDGTIDKFMGDAVLAIWNAPIEVADHADRALAAAEAIIARVASANAVLEKRSLPPLQIGAGLETGICSVGNFGSARRIDYTAIGDTVNLAARLESATKTAGAGLLAGPGFARSTSRELRTVGRLKLYGFDEEIEAFTTAADQSP
ncbi:MAG: adenylate/guanylate cyclase domain-containing protein [Rhizobiaceae bacterium]